MCQQSCRHADLQLAEPREGVVAQSVDGVVVQVEFSQTRTSREGAVGERRQAVGAEPEDAEGGQDRRHAGGHVWDLNATKPLIINLNVTGQLRWFDHSRY